MIICNFCFCIFFFFKQKTAYEMAQCDWSSGVLFRSGPELLCLDERQLVLEPARAEYVALERRAHESLEMCHGVEAADRPDSRRPAVEGQLLPVLGIERLPGGERRRLGVD